MGSTISAITSDEASVAIMVIGMNFMNSPTISGQKSKGIKTASVVAVEAVIGQAIRFAASLYACRFDAPSANFRSAYSVTTMAPSTNMPTLSIKANKTTILMV